MAAGPGRVAARSLPTAQHEAVSAAKRVRSPRAGGWKEGRMRRGVIAGAMVVWMLASCAGPGELARQSEVKLKAGDLRKAYQLARNALAKDRSNVRARAAYDAAA